jgi:hypothetical protein
MSQMDCGAFGTRAWPIKSQLSVPNLRVQRYKDSYAHKVDSNAILMNCPVIFLQIVFIIMHLVVSLLQPRSNHGRVFTYFDSVVGYATLHVSSEDTISGIFVSLEGDLEF